MIKWLLALVSAFGVAVIIMPVVIRIMGRLKVRQTVLHYVAEHKAKSGIPTMGGVGFILALLVTLLLSDTERSLMLVTLAVTGGYGVVGFLDDFIKVFFRRNEGLTAIQKIVFQLFIAIIVSVFAYTNRHVGGIIYTPLGFGELNLGWLAVPLYVVVFLSLTNSVNLTDGLDGLASGVTTIYTLFFAVFIGFYIVFDGGQASAEYQNLIVFCAALIGGLMGFLCYNSYPAKVFMGDTGSLALGGALACLAIFSRRVLIVPILGVMYLVTALSVVIQVGYYKKTKKRVFLMAPIHHHFQQKGMHESKIGFFYCTVTTLAGAILVVAFLIINSGTL